MDVSEIKDPNSFEDWLEDKPEEWAQVLAARCALRVAPMAWSVAALSDDILEKKHRENLTLLTFRANFISSAGRKYPADDMRSSAAANAFDAVDAVDASAAANAFAAVDAAAANAFAAAANAAALASALASALAAAAAANASAAAANAFAAAVDAIWNAVRADCLWLADDLDLTLDDAEVPAEQAQNLMAQPLWLAQDESGNFISQRPPAEIIKAFDKFQTSTLAQETSFGLIADWYIAAQEGKTAFGKKAELAIAKMSREDWGDGDERDCIAVMDRVAEIAGWGRGDEEEIAQPYAPFNYGFSQGSYYTLSAFKNLTVSPEYRDDMWEALRDALKEFYKTKSKDNNAYVPDKLLQSLDKLEKSLGNKPDDLRPGVLQPLWRKLSSCTKSLKSEGGTGVQSFDESINDILDSIDDMRSCYKDIREQEKEVIRLNITPRTVDVILPILSDFHQKIMQADNRVISPEILDTLKAIVELASDETNVETKADIVAEGVLTDQSFMATTYNVIRRISSKTAAVAEDDFADFFGKLPRRAVFGALIYTFGVNSGILQQLTEHIPALEPLLERYNSLDTDDISQALDKDDDFLDV